MYISISIIIPVYNVEKYIAECLDSVLNQTVPFDEIIIINDGSTDKSGEICHSYKSRNSRIKLIEQKNSGLSEARNVGLGIASGDYIIFLDSDDLVSCNLCETIKRIINKYGFLDVIYYASDFIKEIPIIFSEEGYTRDEKVAGVVLNGFESLKKLFPEGFIISACMSAYNISFLKRNNIYFIKGILFEDRFFSLRVITEAENVIYIMDKLYVRRFRADSIITSPFSNKKLNDIFYGNKLEWEYIKQNKKWNTDKLLTQYYALCSAYTALKDKSTNFEKSKIQKEYICNFIDTWFPYFDISSMSINELTLLVFILNIIKSNIEWVYTISYFDAKEKFHSYEEKIRKKLINECKKKLSGLPLGNKVKVGIYGLGNHTKCMLSLYQIFNGKIESEIYFIVSQKNKEIDYQGYAIRTIDNLYKNTDYIIVSSRVYQKEILKQIELAQFETNKILTLYDEHDKVDLCEVYDVLQININN